MKPRKTRAFGVVVFALAAASCGGTLASNADDDASYTPWDDASGLDGRMLADAVVTSTFDANDDESEASSFDADTLDVDPDAPEIAPCLAGPYVFYVEGDTDADGLNGPEMVTGATGNWTASVFSGVLLQVVVTTTSPQFELELNQNDPPHVGTPEAYHFASSGNNYPDILNVVTPEVTCQGGWGGDLTIEELVVPSYNEGAPISRMFASFHLWCGGQAIQGCISYGRD